MDENLSEMSTLHIAQVLSTFISLLLINRMDTSIETAEQAEKFAQELVRRLSV